MSCWRRLRYWQEAGVWVQLHQVLLERLYAAGQIDLSRTGLDSASVRAKKWALPPARTCWDQGFLDISAEAGSGHQHVEKGGTHHLALLYIML
ncbi:UNVERIFIED_ORG: hypothetical protein M2438_005202 [Methylobacterium sp. SuP10 SLI 274]|nr:hypothetical protein [Methylorubrum extorquens]MDF9794718.1 hypothetical protein [Methylorubrum extorquens]MDF9866447.1 hypothetical protein [Methylorubrum pseudosasae]MDH6639956.1 hypothetical protein [Methylobacterium sp. SuP10 SLI 274]MDH6669324.1 hypothetical protein [Methylorubrum zatmanii]